MRQEPKLSDLDSFDEPAASPAQSAPVVQVQKRSMGFFAWLLLLICLTGIGVLGYWNLTLHGESESQGQNQGVQLGSLERRFDELNRNLQSTQAELNKQIALNAELSERLDLLSGQGVSGNAAAIVTVEDQVNQVAGDTQRLAARLDSLLEDLGKSRDQDQSLAQRLAATQSELANVNTLISGLSERLNSQSDRMDAQDQAVASFPSLLAGSETAIERLETRTIQLSDRVATTDTRLVELQSDLLDLANRPVPTPEVNTGALELELAVIQEQVGRQTNQLREITERLRAVDQFRAQTNQAIFRLEDGLRAAQ